MFIVYLDIMKVAYLILLLLITSCTSEVDKKEIHSYDLSLISFKNPTCFMGHFEPLAIKNQFIYSQIIENDIDSVNIFDINNVFSLLSDNSLAEQIIFNKTDSTIRHQKYYFSFGSNVSTYKIENDIIRSFTKETCSLGDYFYSFDKENKGILKVRAFQVNHDTTDAELGFSNTYYIENNKVKYINCSNDQKRIELDYKSSGNLKKARHIKTDTSVYYGVLSEEFDYDKKNRLSKLSLTSTSPYTKDTSITSEIFKYNDGALPIESFTILENKSSVDTFYFKYTYH